MDWMDVEMCTAARRAAEQRGDDAALLRLRQLERAHDALPPLIDGVRRSRLRSADAISVTWEGWEIAGGTRVLLRCLRPLWRDDAVMRRRMAQATAAAAPLPQPQWRPDGDWPHLRIPLEGELLVDWLPLAAPLPEPLLAAVLSRTLQGLIAVHRAGAWMGGALAESIALTDAGPVLLWLDPFDPPGGCSRDLEAAGELAARLDPLGISPLSQQLAGWAHHPPPSAADAAILLQRAMAINLHQHRRRLRRSQGALQHHSAGGQLRALTARLSQALPPPPARACLCATDPPIVAISAGGRVQGGPAPATVPIYTPERGLDPQRARQLLRAWAQRRPEDEPARLRTEEELGGSPQQTAGLIRWLRAAAALRRLRLLGEVDYSLSSRVSR